jgi:opacity protein-like surface antigen
MQLILLIRNVALIGSLVMPVATLAAVLPEDRADVMYHGYNGGGLQVDGPSVLVRKAYKDKVSVWANYYVDMITSASIDVVTTASEYSEQRDEQSVGIDYLTGKTFMGLSYTTSEESDYSSDSVRFGISQDFFGDLTTIGVSYARGRDEVRRNGDETFAEKTDRQNYRVDLTQILTRSLVVSLNYEGITDEGFLNNPYRQVRFVDPREARGYAYQSELYPDTKTSSAFAVRGMYYLPWRASLRAEYRNYSDSWGVSAWNVEAGYTHPFDFGLTLEARYRYYDQTSADFYSDLFPFANSQNFLARDKELASFSNHSVGAGAIYAFNTPWLPFVERGSVNLFVDYMTFDYDDFRDVRVAGGAAGTEPLYSFDSLVLRAFVSLYF